MFHRRIHNLALSLLVLAAAAAAQPAKRPINHHDYDGWRAIAGQRLSPDGHFLVYGLFPEDGDGEVVVRNLITGAENRFPAGSRPTPTPAATPEEEPSAPARNFTVEISADSKTAVFAAYPAKAEIAQAKKDKKPAPTDGMVIVDLASAKSTRIEKVRRFAMPEDASSTLVYSKQSANANADAAPKPENDAADQQGGRGGRGGAGGGGGRSGDGRSQFGSDMIVRNLADGAERTFADVQDFNLSNDGKLLVYSVAGRDGAKNGVYALKLSEAGAAPTALADGKGKYTHLAWDEKQTQLAFLSDRDDPSSKPPKFALYLWTRDGAAASALVTTGTAGFGKGLAISDNGAVSFSRDGKRILFGAAPPPAAPETPAADAGDSDEKAIVELWSYKDDYIQPIQKVRAARDRNRTFTASYSIAAKKVVQLADDSLETVTSSEDSGWALGSDDRAYRIQDDYGERFSDAYLVDSATGKRTLLVKKHTGQVTWSPGGKYALYFDGKNWNTVSVPAGKTTNLTANLPNKFWNEDFDSPSTPGSYGTAGWTEDGKVLLYDHYDIWSVAPDGSSAKNITNGYGRAHDLQLRYVRTETDPRERWIDPAKPLLLRAENQQTRDSGFFRASLAGGDPKQLIMGKKDFSAPVKAKNADVYLLTEQTFSEFPDLITTDASFKEMRKVSDANPQKAGLSWETPS